MEVAVARSSAPSSAAQRTGAVPMVAAPQIAFWGLLVLILLEYVGVSQDFAFLRAARVSTLLAFVVFGMAAMAGGIRFVPETRQGRLFVALMGMAAASLLYAVVRSYVPMQLRVHVDYVIFFIAVASIMNTRARVLTLAVVVTCMIGFLVARNIDALTASSRIAGFRAGTFMGDGNDFAWGLIALSPFPLILMLGGGGMVLRLLGVVGMAAVAQGVVGTQSRGAALALVAAAVYFVLTLSRRRTVALVFAGIAAVGALAVAPSTFVGRMNTSVETDSSAQGRLRAWTAAAQMAVDFPLGVGAGSFNSAYGRYYMAEADDVFSSRRWISAHSIYFKALGEFGFIGLGLVLALVWINVRETRQLHAAARARPGATTFDERWPAALSFGVVGFAVGGAFLGGLTYPHIYLLSGLIVACRQMDAAARPAPGAREESTGHAALAHTGHAGINRDFRAAAGTRS